MSLRHLVVIIVNDLALPAVARNADRTDLVIMADTQMNTSGAGRFGKTVVGVILMIREVVLPVLNQGRRHRLCTDVHKPPLIQLIILQLHIARIERIQNILSPRHKKPDNGAFFIRNSRKNRRRIRAS